MIIYDYIIIGSGIAGNVCSYLLSKQGKKCLILEKDNIRKEKTCGGGIPYKACKKLIDIGIDISNLLKKDISLINGDCTYYTDKFVHNKYTGEYAIGCKRALFDEYLLEQAISVGVEIRRGEYVSKICRDNEIFEANGYFSKNLVVATGARGLGPYYTKGQSVGISAQIYGKCDLKPDIFYFWYYDNTEDKYFWIFPIGKNIWNIGIWFKYPDKYMKREFDFCTKSIIGKHFEPNYLYLQQPKGEFCGNVDLRYTKSIFLDGIGDFAGLNNIKNGGGIYKAIKSAIEYVNSC